MNRVELTGRLVKDAELKFTAGKGTAVAKFQIAVDYGFGDNKETSFIPVTVWGKGAESVANYTSKGSKIAVCGRIKTGSYEGKNGKVYTTEVVADTFGGIEFLDNKSSGVQAQANKQQETFDDDITPVYDGDAPF